MIQIAYLADHPHLVHTLAEWFKAEWAEYYTDRSQDDVAHELSDDLNYDHIPIRLVAFVDGTLAGGIVLREQVVSTEPMYTPGLGGLLVAQTYRHQGVGTELVQAGMKLAERLGYPVIYTTTNSARSIIEKLHWERLGTVSIHGEEIGLYRYFTRVS